MEIWRWYVCCDATVSYEFTLNCSVQCSLTLATLFFLSSYETFMIWMRMETKINWKQNKNRWSFVMRILLHLHYLDWISTFIGLIIWPGDGRWLTRWNIRSQTSDQNKYNVILCECADYGIAHTTHIVNCMVIRYIAVASMKFFAYFQPHDQCVSRMSLEW